MSGPSGPQAPPGRETARLDKWLWQARFFKTRGLAAKLIDAGRVRVNGTRVTRPGRAIGAGDALTFPQAGEIRVIRILGLGDRRGPAAEARALYEDLGRPAGSEDPEDEDADSA